MEATQNSRVEDFIEFAMEVIHRAGDEALSYYGKGRLHIKFDNELVTEAELHLIDFFQNQIQNAFPEHQLFTNNHQSDAIENGKKTYLWIFDALDGVANFQAGIPMWGMSVSLMENLWPIFGAFYMPSTGDLFYAKAGKKAFLGKEEISISDQDSINEESVFLTYSRFTHHFHNTFPGKIRNLGSTAAHICYVAKGCAEVAIISNESYQDLAAVQIIIEAAGGKIFKLDGDEFFLNEYIDGKRIEDQLLVVSQDIYSEVLDYLQPVD